MAAQRQDQSLNWLLIPRPGPLKPLLFALDSTPCISVAVLLAGSRLLRSQWGVFLDGWRTLEGASYPSQHWWLWSVSIGWFDKTWQPLCGSSLHVVLRENKPRLNQRQCFYFHHLPSRSHEASSVFHTSVSVPSSDPCEIRPFKTIPSK